MRVIQLFWGVFSISSSGDILAVTSFADLILFWLSSTATLLDLVDAVGDGSVVAAATAVCVSKKSTLVLTAGIEERPQHSTTK